MGLRPVPRLLAALAVAAGSLLALPAAAAGAPPRIISTMSPQEMATLLQDAGYRAERMASEDPPRVQTGMGGYTVMVFFYDCKEQNCSALQFWAAFKKVPSFTLDFANRWNIERRYAKAYIDKEGGLALEFDVDLDGAVTPEYIKQKVLLFERLLAELDAFEAK